MNARARLQGFVPSRPGRDDHKLPGDPDVLPLADAIVVAPATFNTVILAPYAKPSLAAHPVFERNLRTLEEWGVTVLPNEVIRVGTVQDTFDWRPVADALA